MARKPRLHVPAGFYHVILRGNGGQDIFFAKGDRIKFLLLLEEITERFSCRLHAYCLMSNHIHLVLQVGEAPLAKIIQNISFRYTRFINKRKNRIGHLFQGRYKALLIDADNYLLELVRYIHNNPVRAQMVADPIDYQWSSHRAYLDKEKIPFMTTAFVLSQFGVKQKTSRQNYSDFILKGLAEGRRADFYQGESDSRVLGDDGFTDFVLNRRPTYKRIQLTEIITYVCKRYGVEDSDLKLLARRRDHSEIRGIIGWLSISCKAAPLTEVAHHFKRDLSTLSRIVSGLEKRAATSGEYSTLLRQYQKEILGN